MTDVNPARRYDSTARRRQAERTRATIIAVARRQFLDAGYAATTVPGIAKEAGVSAETVYKAFGAKPDIVRALWQRGLDGRGPVPAPQRSDSLSETATDPVQVIRGWGRLTTEVAPEVAPVLLLIRDAAAADADMAVLLGQTERQRRDRMQHNARRLRSSGWLRAGLTTASTTDILWTYSSPELYELLVIKSRWPLRRYGDFVADAMIAALLDNSSGSARVGT